MQSLSTWYEYCATSGHSFFLLSTLLSKSIIRGGSDMSAIECSALKFGADKNVTFLKAIISIIQKEMAIGEIVFGLMVVINRLLVLDT
jgi:hypothetical protein